MEEVKKESDTKRELPVECVVAESHLEPEKTVKQLSVPELCQKIPEENGNMQHGEQAAISEVLIDKDKYNGDKSEVKQSKEICCKRLKFQDEVYELHDNVLIRETETTNMVARIEKIIRENGDLKHPKWPMIEVTW